MNEEEELAEIRKKKLEELQRAQEEQLQREQAIAQAKVQIDRVMKQVLEPDAWDQWNNAKFGNEDIAYAGAQVILQAIKTGQIKGKVSKEQLRSILSEVNKATHREFKILRK